MIFTAAIIATPAVAEVGEPIVKPMAFEACLETVRSIGQSTGSAPVNIVETNDTRVVRMAAADGSLLVTCSRAKGTMTMTPSSRRCGVDVEC